MVSFFHISIHIISVEVYSIVLGKYTVPKIGDHIFIFKKYTLFFSAILDERQNWVESMKIFQIPLAPTRA